MATTMVPAATAAKPPHGEVRFVAVRARLLPDEIVSDRQVEVVRKQVIAGLVLVVVILIAAFGLSKWQTRSANNDLATAQRQGAQLESEQNQFAPLVQAQAQIQAIQNQLHSLMRTDLSWKTMLTTLQAKAPSGVTIDSVAGTVNAGTATAGGAAGVPAGTSVLNASGQPAVGTLTVSGTAPDKRTVAAYADQLATVKGLAAPLVSSVAADPSGAKFTIVAVITSDALGGRYAAAPATTGGH